MLVALLLVPTESRCTLGGLCMCKRLCAYMQIFPNIQFVVNNFINPLIFCGFTTLRLLLCNCVT